MTSTNDSYCSVLYVGMYLPIPNARYGTIIELYSIWSVLFFNESFTLCNIVIVFAIFSFIPLICDFHVRLNYCSSIIKCDTLWWFWTGGPTCIRGRQRYKSVKQVYSFNPGVRISPKPGMIRTWILMILTKSQNTGRSHTGDKQIENTRKRKHRGYTCQAWLACDYLIPPLTGTRFSLKTAGQILQRQVCKVLFLLCRTRQTNKQLTNIA